jgi:hypothetical protein
MKFNKNILVLFSCILIIIIILYIFNRFILIENFEIKCQEGNYIYNSNGKFRCNNQRCPDNKPYIDENNYKKCVDKCPPEIKDKEIYNYNGECVAKCPGDKKYLNNGECVSKCPGDKKYSYDGVCVAKCPGDKKYINDGQCVAKCPNDKEYINDGECVAKCPNDKKYINNGVCVYCRTNFYNKSDKKCIQSCPLNMLIDNVNKRCIRPITCKDNKQYINGNFCLDSCPDDKSYINDGQCVDKCPDDMLKYGNLCITRKSCDYGHERKYIRDGECVFCDDDKYYYYDETTKNWKCESKCPQDQGLGFGVGTCKKCKNYEFINNNSICSQHNIKQGDGINVIPSSIGRIFQFTVDGGT